MARHGLAGHFQRMKRCAARVQRAGRWCPAPWGTSTVARRVIWQHRGLSCRLGLQQGSPSSKVGALMLTPSLAPWHACHAGRACKGILSDVLGAKAKRSTRFRAYGMHNNPVQVAQNCSAAAPSQRAAPRLRACASSALTARRPVWAAEHALPVPAHPLAVAPPAPWRGQAAHAASWHPHLARVGWQPPAPAPGQARLPLQQPCLLCLRNAINLISAGL